MRNHSETTGSLQAATPQAENHVLSPIPPIAATPLPLAGFLLLTVLAIIMRVILVLFPEKEMEEDSAMLAAVATTINTMFPGTKITKIEEIK